MKFLLLLLAQLSNKLREANVGSEHALVIDFRFGEQNGPLVQFLLAIFGGLTARFVRFAADLLLPLLLLPFLRKYKL